MATVIPIGEPVNDAERLGIDHLRDHLSSGYLIFHTQLRALLPLEQA